MSEDNEAVPTEETTPEQKNTDPVQLEFDFGQDIMDALIASVVPPTGFYCLTTIHNDAPRQVFFSDRTELVNAGITASKAGKNAYYAMASFKDGSSRTQKNVQELKAFWLDVDCKNKLSSFKIGKPNGFLKLCSKFKLKI